ncbi:MAG: ribonuclease III [Bryobacteraceae bacterium]|nr:ribonuclease III [Bryobacteraceae bacterium]
MDDKLRALELAIGHTFRDRTLLERALTHSSTASEANGRRGAQGNNEQFEFLGDAVLGFLVSEELVRRFPDLPEGQLTIIKSRVVSAAYLYRIARKLDLGAYLFLGRGEDRAGGREKKTVLADALEALIAAVFLDAGVDATRTFVLNHLVENAALEPSDDPGSGNAKSALQELTMALKLPLPRYRVIEESGPDHSKRFTVEVRIGRDHSATGEGSSKKTASMRAAGAALAMLEEVEHVDTT